MSLTALMLSSCQFPQVSNLPSSDNNNDNDNDNDDDDSDDNSRRRNSGTVCGDRDACQVNCENLFCSNSARKGCYDLLLNEVDGLNEVGDALDVSCDSSNDMELDAINKNDLEDLSKDDWDAYLKIGVDDLVEAVENITKGGSATGKMKIFLEWVGDNSDIADVVLSHDQNLDLGRAVFERHGQNITVSNSRMELAIDGGAEIVLRSNAQINGDSLFRVELELKEIADFISGFIRVSLTGTESFMSYSDAERNDKAFEWGHNTLVNFCEDLVDKDKDNVDVKQCLQAVYCAHRLRENDGIGTDEIIGSSLSPISASEVTSDGIFRELEDDYEDLVGNVNVRYCRANQITDEGRVEDLFDR